MEVCVADILLCREAVSYDHLQRTLGIPAESLIGMDNKVPSMIMPLHPYLISEQPSYLDRNIQAILGTSRDLRGLAELNNMCRSCHVTSIANIHKRLKDTKIQLPEYKVPVHRNEHEAKDAEGSSAFHDAMELGNDIFIESREHLVHLARGVSTSTDELANHITRYLMSVRKYVSAKKLGNSPLANLAREEAKSTFKRMQNSFRAGMKTLENHIAIDWDGVENETRNLVRQGSKIISRLHIKNLFEARNLERLAKGSKWLGEAAVYLNIYEGGKKVIKTYEHGGNWERSLTAEALKIAADLALGEIAVTAGVAIVAVAVEVGADVGVILISVAALAALVWGSIKIIEGSNKFIDYLTKEGFKGISYFDKWLVNHL